MTLYKTETLFWLIMLQTQSLPATTKVGLANQKMKNLVGGDENKINI
jgi:hypothetical protein